MTDWFFPNKFYRVVNSDGITAKNFKNNLEIGGINTAPDWDPDPRIDCGHGLHVVPGHPLMAWIIAGHENPIFFEVKTEPHPPIPSLNREKCRAKKVTNIRRLDIGSPEFKPEIVKAMFKQARVLNSRFLILEVLKRVAGPKMLMELMEEEEGYMRRSIGRILEERWWHVL